MQNAMWTPNQLCQGKYIVACDLFEVDNQVAAKRFPCSYGLT